METPSHSKVLITHPPAKDAKLADEETLECIIAAILAAGTFGADGGGARTAVRRYADTLVQLREVGGALNPKPPVEKN